MEKTLNSREALAVSAADGDILVSGPSGGAPLFRLRDGGYRMGEAMDLLRRTNTLPLADGRPLHAVAARGDYSLWACRQHYLLFPYLMAYAQFPELFDRLAELGWPALRAASPLPGELGRCIQALRSPGSDARGMSGAKAAAARVLLPMAWAASARRRGSRVAIYTSDLVSDKKHGCDFRFAKVYDWLAEAGLAGSEIFHLIDARTAFANARARGRIPLYPELWGRTQTEFPDPPILDGLPPGLRALLGRALPGFMAACRLSAARVDGLRRTLRASGVRLLLAMDDYRSSQEVLIACRLEGIRAIWIQHGLVSRFHPGMVPAGIPEANMAAPDRFLARAPFWKTVLDTYAPRLGRVATVVSGLDAPAASTGDARPPAFPGPGEPLVVLFLLETLWDPSEAARFLNRMLDDPRLRVHFKIRPDMDREKQVRPYFGERDPHEVSLDLAAEFARAHVIVGSHSSLLYKLLDWRRPVFRLRTSFEFGEQLSRFGLTEDLALEDDYHARFMEALRRDPAEYRKRWEAYQGTGAHPDYREVLAREADAAGGQKPCKPLWERG